MRFYSVEAGHRDPPSDAAYPCAVLERDGWNDFGYITTFRIYLYSRPGSLILKSTTKILQRDRSALQKGRERTDIPVEFSALSEQYCSLGQELDYYETLFAAGRLVYEPFLVALRDAAYDQSIGSTFYGVDGFRTSLLRFSTAEKAFREAASIFTGIEATQLMNFQFQCDVRGASAPHSVHFDFSPHPTGLHRTAVLIGRNGTGKTQFLAHFAMAMSGQRDTRDPESGFVPRRPSFSQVIAVSYSAFDDFKRPAHGSRSFSYRYCGIREPNKSATSIGENASADTSGVEEVRLLTIAEIKQRLELAHARILTMNRDGQWRAILAILLHGTIDATGDELSSLAFYDKLSAGQRIVVATMTEIVAHIDKDSIVLFDEPELHLHPEMFVALARAIARLLHEFDSYAIIATHSALLLQETLSRQVRIFARQGDIPLVMPLTVESFGDSLTSITNQVFSVDGSQLNFRAVLDELHQGKSAAAVDQMFPLGLPLQARAYLQALDDETSG